MRKPLAENDPIVARTQAADILRAAGLEERFNALLRTLNDSPLDFISGCHTLMEQQPDPEIRAALLHHIVGSTFNAGSEYALRRRRDDEEFEANFRTLTSLPLDHPIITDMVEKHRAQAQA